MDDDELRERHFWVTVAEDHEQLMAHHFRITVAGTLTAFALGLIVGVFTGSKPIVLACTYLLVGWVFGRGVYAAMEAKHWRRQEEKARRQADWTAKRTMAYLEEQEHRRVGLRKAVPEE